MSSQDSESGIVIEVSEGRAVVRLERKEKCHSCTICKPAEGGMLMEARDPVGVKPGDHVLINRPPEAILKATFLIFGLPLIAMLGGALLFRFIFPDKGEGLWALGGGLGLVVSFGALLFYDRCTRAKKESDYLPEISSVL